MAIFPIHFLPAQVMLLDDPLSALDAETGRAIFAALLGSDGSGDDPRSRKGLLCGCATILVTHAVQYLGRATNVLVLNDSRVTFYGSHRQVRTPDPSSLKSPPSGEGATAGASHQSLGSSILLVAAPSLRASLAASSHH